MVHQSYCTRPVHDQQPDHRMQLPDQQANCLKADRLRFLSKRSVFEVIEIVKFT